MIKIKDNIIYLSGSNIKLYLNSEGFFLSEFLSDGNKAGFFCYKLYKDNNCLINVTDKYNSFLSAVT